MFINYNYCCLGSLGHNHYYCNIRFHGRTQLSVLIELSTKGTNYALMANNLYSSSSSFRVERLINFVRQSQLSETHWKLAKRNYDAHVCNITYKKYYRFNVCIQLMTTHCISVFRPARWDCVGRNFHLFCTVPGLSLQCTLGKSEYLSCCTCYTLNIL